MGINPDGMLAYQTGLRIIYQTDKTRSVSGRRTSKNAEHFEMGQVLYRRREE